jgi:hypothetical protein
MVTQRAGAAWAFTAYGAERWKNGPPARFAVTRRAGAKFSTRGRVD